MVNLIFTEKAPKVNLLVNHFL